MHLRRVNLYPEGSSLVLIWTSNQSELPKMIEAALGGEFSIPGHDQIKTKPPVGRNVTKGILLSNCTSFLLILEFLVTF